MAKIKLAKIHAILGRSHRTGRWRLSPKTSVVALLGSCRLDLRDAKLDGEVSKMTATVMFGGVTLIIPPGVEVRPSGLSLLGGASVDVPPFEDGEATTLIEIEWTSVFGRLRIGAGDEEPDEETDEDQAGDLVEDGVEAEEPATGAGPAVVAATEAKPAAETVGPPPAVGFEDLDEPAASDDPPAAVGFEDLDEPAASEDPPAAVGFEDLDEPETTEDEGTTPNRRSDDPAPQPGDEAVEDETSGDEAGEPDEPEPAAVGFEDL